MYLQHYNDVLKSFFAPCRLKVLLLLLCFNGSHVETFSQILPLTTLAFDQKFSLNPSFVGTNDYSIISVSSKKQWLGIPNSPLTVIAGGNFKLGNFSFYKPNGLLNKTGIKTYDRSGAGVLFYTDQAGFIRNSGISLSYAYHIPIKKSKLSAGLTLKLSQNHFQNDKLTPHQPNDPLVPEFIEANYHLNSAFGVSYYQPFNFYAGLSVDNAIGIFSSVQKDLQLSEYRNRIYHFVGGKYFHLSNFRTLEPFLIVSAMEGYGIKSHMGLRFYYKKGSWIALIEDDNFASVQGNIAILIRKFTYCLGYSYFLTPVSKYQNGSVEFSIIARFGDLSRIKVY